MKRKLYKYIVVIAGVFTMSSMSSCDDFLTVRPKSDYPDYLLFTTLAGFQDALIGVYQLMRQTTYGVTGPAFNSSNTTGNSNLFEYLSCFWPVSSATSTEQQAYTHDYTQTYIQWSISSYFEHQYRCITNLNLILKWVDDESQNFLSEREYSMVKGEALAIKSFIMFDLIRAFGPPPASTSLHDEEYIPYPFEVDIYAYPAQTYTKYMEYLMIDLLEAERLLREYDPILTGNSALDWNAKRELHMNYYSTVALKARVLLYQGDKEGALECAQTVIDSNLFTFLPAASYAGSANSGDNLGYPEQIFGLKVDYAVVFDYASASSTVKYDVSHPGGTTGQMTFFINAFEPSLSGAGGRYPYMSSNDIRFNKHFLFYPSAHRVVGVKHNALNNVSSVSALPMLRLAEMYLIAAECVELLSDAQDILNELREQRWTSAYSGANVVSLSTEDERMRWIIGEYAREFINEGQTFFAYKRLGLDRIPYAVHEFDTQSTVQGPVYMSDTQYILPVPEGEYLGSAGQ